MPAGPIRTYAPLKTIEYVSIVFNGEYVSVVFNGAIPYIRIRLRKAVHAPDRREGGRERGRERERKRDRDREREMFPTAENMRPTAAQDNIDVLYCL